MIVEPLLQGAGGMIVHPVEFLQRVRQLCAEHEVLLIADEVLTGFGRCGKMFACELAGVAPDLMCLSKGLTGGVLPMGATVCTSRIHEAFVSEDRSRTFYHGHSYTGKSPGCRGREWPACGFSRTSRCLSESRRSQGIHRERLAAIQAHPAVGDTRSIGVVAAIELRADDAGYFSKLRPRLYKFFVEVRECFCGPSET